MTEESKEMIGIMKDMFEGLSNKIDKLEKGQDELKMTLENITNKNISALVDGHLQNSTKLEKLDKLAVNMEIVQFDVDIIKKVVTTHSTQLDKMGKAN